MRWKKNAQSPKEKTQMRKWNCHKWDMDIAIFFSMKRWASGGNSRNVGGVTRILAYARKSLSTRTHSLNSSELEFVEKSIIFVSHTHTHARTHKQISTIYPYTLSSNNNKTVSIWAQEMIKFKTPFISILHCRIVHKKQENSSYTKFDYFIDPNWAQEKINKSQMSNAYVFFSSLATQL